MFANEADRKRFRREALTLAKITKKSARCSLNEIAIDGLWRIAQVEKRELRRCGLQREGPGPHWGGGRIEPERPLHYQHHSLSFEVRQNLWLGGNQTACFCFPFDRTKSRWILPSVDNRLMTFDIAAPPSNLREMWAPWDRIITVRGDSYRAIPDIAQFQRSPLGKGRESSSSREQKRGCELGVVESMVTADLGFLHGP